MKKLVYIAIFTFSGFFLRAQSLQIVDTETNQRGLIGQEIRTVLKIKNVADKPVKFRISLVREQIGSSQKSFLCIDNDCDNSNIAQRRHKITEVIHQVNPGEVDKSITVVLETGLVRAIGTVTYQVTNISNPEDFTKVEFQYEVNEPPEEGLLYSSKSVELRDVYPNPATEVAIFDYLIKDDSKEAKIIIHNVLGSVAGEFNLNPYEQRLKVPVDNFNPGVYFYSLYIDNEGVATKKLVVRK